MKISSSTRYYNDTSRYHVLVDIKAPSDFARCLKWRKWWNWNADLIIL